MATHSREIRKPNVQLARQRASELLANEGISATPVDPLTVARALGIQLKPVSKNPGFSGCLRGLGDSWTILYRDDIPNRGFQRFTVAHELGHYESPEHHDVMFSSQGEHSSESDYQSRAWYEIEADHFAAELLMPTAIFKRALRGKVLGLGAVKALAMEFETSLTSTAIRYAQLTQDPVSVIISASGRVLYCYSSSCMTALRAGFIENGEAVPPASATCRTMGASATGEVEERCFLSAWFPNVSRDIEFREDVKDLGAYGRTLTILHYVEIPSDDPLDLTDGEDPDDGGFNRDGKRYRF